VTCSMPAPGTCRGDLWLLDLQEHEGELLARSRVLAPEETERRDRFLRDQDRQRYAAAHVGLRLLLSSYTGVPARTLAFTADPCHSCGGPHGKPALVGRDVAWSMSHAADRVLYGVSTREIGVDIELLRDDADVLARALHPQERDAISRLHAQQRPRAFLSCWTRKEAYLKGTGAGLTIDPAQCLVGFGAQAVAPPGWTIADVPAAGYVAAAAVKRVEAALEDPVLTVHSFSELLDRQWAA
jgi:4'-phosphopantetheinyl transferase